MLCFLERTAVLCPQSGTEGDWPAPANKYHPFYFLQPGLANPYFLTRSSKPILCLPDAVGTGLAEGETGQAEPDWPALADWHLRSFPAKRALRPARQMVLGSAIIERRTRPSF